MGTRAASITGYKLMRAVESMDEEDAGGETHNLRSHFVLYVADSKHTNESQMRSSTRRILEHENTVLDSAIDSSAHAGS